MDESLLDAFFVPVEGMQSEQCGDELILFDSASQESFYLNGSAALIWALLDGVRSVRDVYHILSDAYEEGPTEAEIVASVEEFVSAGVVRQV